MLLLMPSCDLIFLDDLIKKLSTDVVFSWFIVIFYSSLTIIKETIVI